MHRFAPGQTELFAPVAELSAASERPVVVELRDLLTDLRSAERLPWPDAAATMAEERRALGLARLAGDEGAGLAAEILRETERLLAAAEQDAADGAAR
jgi:hypothetical protein